eukprot:CAMPEP_0117597376 /NCGR_PEP_ID=MMETSP0784-20121206/74823_1 /TAXON_ID=39447 /ORGANISM="" /LENGTH=48 /DNA_ID= /DNA_START= /DNA_END= /DNA_ORIENTATION=
MASEKTGRNAIMDSTTPACSASQDHGVQRVVRNMRGESVRASNMRPPP